MDPDPKHRHRPYRRPGRVVDPIHARTAMERVAETLGVAVLVDEIEPGPPATIHAVLLYTGTLSGNVEHALTVSGASEAEAWRRLTAEMIAWRRGNAMALPYWPGGGG